MNKRTDDINYLRARMIKHYNELVYLFACAEDDGGILIVHYDEFFDLMDDMRSDICFLSALEIPGVCTSIIHKKDFILKSLEDDSESSDFS
ncbi:MAG TPA: hypothetical protein PKD70_11160 [Saprospiraceae bacterium]|nr:hypothetical protein [Saprospiraceae bacterium]HMP14430.1 hypothetical protein [Saprospiraceae bacterium]